MSLICWNCKAEIETGKKFCSDCGSSIEINFDDKSNSIDSISQEVPNYAEYIEKTTARNSKVIVSFIFIAILCGLGYGAYSLVSSGLNSISNSFSPNSTRSIPEVSGHVGEQVNDGQMTFVLNSAPVCFNSTSATKLCKFDVSIGNHSKTSASFFDSAQKLVDANGNLYDVASPYERSDYSVSFVMSDLNPGMGIRGNLFFEIPKGVSPTKLIFHDSMFSGGVAVGL